MTHLISIRMVKDTRLVKHSGQVFTPDYLVRNMLDFCGYTGEQILSKHIIDNSCGDGAFLCEAVDRYCSTAIHYGMNITQLTSDLATFIHGIELDRTAFNHCFYNLNRTVSSYGIQNVPWDILNCDALQISRFDNQMHFVIGNPPYVRVHNLEENYTKVKTFLFANGGMTDLYLVFYELGMRMLKQGGRLCYITPSSWLTSVAAQNMRRYILQRKNLIGIIDLEHFQPFENATTYTLIALFDNGMEHDHVNYATYDAEKKCPQHIDTIPLKEISINGEFFLATREQLAELRNIKLYPSQKYVSVKNGFATLTDKVFIGRIPFRKYVIRVIKASTGIWKEAFFPYDENGKPLSKERIFGDKKIAEYLNENKSILLKGKTDEQHPEWYLYGRTQALKDVFCDKLSISTIIKDINSIKLNYVPKGSGIYSGLYILSQKPFEEISKILLNEHFISYIKLLRNYKSGGYYTFNSKAIEIYLNYKLTEKYDGINTDLPKRQSDVFERDINFI